MVPVQVAVGGWRLPGQDAAGDRLSRLGLPPGRRLGLLGTCTDEHAALIAAALEQGRPLVLLHPRWTQAEREDLIRRSRCLPPDVAVSPDPGDPQPATEALLLAGSGTSGRPRLVRLGRAALLHTARATVDRLGLGCDDRWLCCVPFAHIAGIGCLTRALVSGHHLVLAERFDPIAVSTAIDQGRITGASLVPTMLRRLCAARQGRPFPPALRCLMVGGGPLDPHLAAEAGALGCPPSQTYGLTEACGTVTCQSPRAGGLDAGRPLEGVELRLVDGQIHLRSPSLFLGYEDGGGPDPDGWFATGDLGDVNAAGCLRVLCRRQDLILSGGENVYPTEVETALLAHPAVHEALVLGLPDPEWGQQVAALLTGPLPLPEDELLAFLAARLAPYKRPRRLRWVPELPRGPGGKPDREAARLLLDT